MSSLPLAPLERRSPQRLKMFQIFKRLSRRWLIILDSLSRQKVGSVKAELRKLHGKKLAHGSAKDGYQLTQVGHAAALAEAAKLAD